MTRKPEEEGPAIKISLVVPLASAEDATSFIIKILNN
jgi:hypothetical protein